MAASPILNLETLEGFTVTIDGKAYRMYAPDGLPIVAYKRLSSLSVRLDQLWKRQDLSEQEEQELAAVLDELCRIIIDAPDDVHQKLTDVQRLLVFQTFQQLPTTHLRSVRQQTQAEAKSRTGGKSSRVFRSFTAGTHGAGSKKSRSA